MSNQRLREVVEDVERTLLALFRKHQVTHEEYRAATDLLIASIKEGEESLLFDVFFEAEATDAANAGRVGSPAAIEGPFYLAGAPYLSAPCVMPQRPDEQGEPLTFRGTAVSFHSAVRYTDNEDALRTYRSVRPSRGQGKLQRACQSNQKNETTSARSRADSKSSSPSRKIGPE